MTTESWAVEAFRGEKLVQVFDLQLDDVLPLCRVGVDRLDDDAPVTVLANSAGCASRGMTIGFDRWADTDASTTPRSVLISLPGVGGRRRSMLRFAAGPDIVTVPIMPVGPSGVKEPRVGLCIRTDSSRGLSLGIEFRSIGEVPAVLAPLRRGNHLRLCLKLPFASSNRRKGPTRSNSMDLLCYSRPGESTMSTTGPSAERRRLVEREVSSKCASGIPGTESVSGPAGGVARTMIDFNRIQVGRCFVSEKKGLIREITGETADGMVHWRSYVLGNGRSTGDELICSKDHICRWADREATEEETATLERDAPTFKDLAAVAMINHVLANLSDEQLIHEISRRGDEVVWRKNVVAQKKGTRT